MAKKRKFKKKAQSLNSFERSFKEKIIPNEESYDLAPYFVLLLCGTIIFFLGMRFTSKNTLIDNTNLDVIKSQPTPIQIHKANTIYVFKVRQALSSQVPSYSQMEIELLDENFNHIYTAYENLWQEKHDNDNGGKSVYSDKLLEFEIDLKYAGKYHIRTTSYNDNKGKVSLNLYTKNGSLYFKTFMYIFGVLFLLCFFLIMELDGISSIFKALHKTKITRTFILAIIIVIFVFISCVVISNTHYGYPHSGDEIRLPTYFFSTNDVKYLG
jgi:hypothetical protein